MTGASQSGLSIAAFEIDPMTRLVIASDLQCSIERNEMTMETRHCER